MVGGERVDSAEGRTFEVATRHRDGRWRRSPRPASRMSNRAVAAAVAGLRELGGAVAGDARTAYAPLRDAGRGARRGAGAARVPATSACRSPMPAASSGMIVDVIRYYAGAVDKFFGHTVPVERDGVALTFREPIGVVGPDHALELPAQHRELEDRPGAGGGEHGRPEAGVADAALRRFAMAELARRGGDPRGRAERRSRARRRQSATALVEHPGRRQDRVHRVDRGRGRDRPPGGGDDQARDARAGRQVGLRRLRRRRPREGRRGWRRTRCSRTAARTAARAHG